MGSGGGDGGAGGGGVGGKVEEVSGGEERWRRTNLVKPSDTTPSN